MDNRKLTTQKTSTEPITTQECSASLVIERETQIKTTVRYSSQTRTAKTMIITNENNDITDNEKAGKVMEEVECSKMFEGWC